MKYNVLIYPAAEADMADIKDYYQNKLKISINSLLDKFMDTVLLLEVNPLMFPVVSDPYLARKGYRKFMIGHYLVFYVVHETTVQIRRVLFAKRLYSEIL